MKKQIVQRLRAMGLYPAAKAGEQGLLKLWRHTLNRFLHHETILVYHRIADVSQDPHQLCVSPQNFRAQLAYLKTHYQVVPLAEIVHDLKNKSLKTGKVAITFDDGYADNLSHALPILEEFQAPATIFVTTGAIESQKDFYWDAETPREDRGKPLSIEELHRLSNHPLIEMGAHTVHHPKLSAVGPEIQDAEVQGSKTALEQMVGTEVRAFAYPFGSRDAFTKTTVATVEKAGFQFACANTQQQVYFFSPLFALPRIVVRNSGVDALEARLRL